MVYTRQRRQYLSPGHAMGDIIICYLNCPRKQLLRRNAHNVID